MVRRALVFSLFLLLPVLLRAQTTADSLAEQTADGQRFVEHAVAAGETPWSIAGRYGVSLDELRRHNVSLDD
ncbi:MAG: LysM domain-containing protein, partial [Catalinimonas sp.]